MVGCGIRGDHVKSVFYTRNGEFIADFWALPVCGSLPPPLPLFCKCIPAPNSGAVEIPAPSLQRFGLLGTFCGHTRHPTLRTSPRSGLLTPRVGVRSPAFAQWLGAKALVRFLDFAFRDFFSCSRSASLDPPTPSIRVHTTHEPVGPACWPCALGERKGSQGAHRSCWGC